MQQPEGGSRSMLPSRRRLTVRPGAGGEAFPNLEVLNIDHSNSATAEHQVTEEQEQDCEVPVECLPQLVQALSSQSAQQQLEATRKIRKMLSEEVDPPLQDVIDAGTVPIMLEFLRLEAQSEEAVSIQFEAAWAITNIVAGSSEQIAFVLEQGAIPVFVNLLSSPSNNIQEQAVWALGNIAADNPKTRDAVIAHNAIPGMIPMCLQGERIHMQRNATWALGNLCRGKPPISLETAKSILPTIVQVVVSSSDEEVWSDALWALVSVLDGNGNAGIEAVLQSGVVPRAVELLSHSSTCVVTPALSVISNIAQSPLDPARELLLNCGLLAALPALLQDKKRRTRVDASTTVAAIASGPPQHVQALADSGLFPLIIAVAGSDELSVRREAVAVLSNALSARQPDLAMFLVQQNCLPVLCETMASTDMQTQLRSVEAVESILVCSMGQSGDARPLHGLLQQVGVVEALAGMVDSSRSVEVKAAAQRALDMAAAQS